MNCVPTQKFLDKKISQQDIYRQRINSFLDFLGKTKQVISEESGIPYQKLNKVLNGKLVNATSGQLNKVYQMDIIFRLL